MTVHVIVQTCVHRKHGITFLTLKNEPHDSEQPRYFTQEEKQYLMTGQVMEFSMAAGGRSDCIGMRVALSSA